MKSNSSQNLKTSVFSLTGHINQNKNLDYSNIEPGKFLSCRDFWLKWWQKEQRENKLNRIIKDT